MLGSGRHAWNLKRLGYFALKSSENSQNSIKKLLKRGYIKLNEETAKIYGDLF